MTTNPTQSATDAELVRRARDAASNTVYGHLDDLLSELASRIEAPSASRREYGKKCWKAGYQAYSDMIVQQSNGRKYSVMVAERMHADLDALESEGE